MKPSHPKSQSGTQTVSAAFETQLQQKIDNKTKPPGSLGKLEQLAHQIATVQSSLEPLMERCELTIFAADHGIATTGVSAYPQEVTRQMVFNFLAGGAASNVFCDALDIDFQVVDAGIAGEPIIHNKLLSRSIASGTQNCISGPAMTEQQCQTALNAGYDIANNSNAQAVCFGEMGIGNTSSATLLSHKILGLALEDITGAGTGLDKAGIKNKLALLTTAASRTGLSQLSPLDALREYGGFEIAMMVGAMRGAAANQKIIIVDGFIATAASVVAINLDSSIRENLVFAHLSDEQGHQRILHAINATPLLHLGLRLGEGTGALLSWPLVKAAAAFLNNMASFESAHVSGPA